MSSENGLFSLEVFIDKIIYAKNKFSDKYVKTCVFIECNLMRPLEICDDNSIAYAVSGRPHIIKNFNSGKSSLFSLSTLQTQCAMNRFLLNVTVYNELPCGCLPTKIVLGKSSIDMTNEFVETLKSFLENPNEVSQKVVKDFYILVGPDNVHTGKILMSLKLSCYGKMIKSQFSRNSDLPDLGACLAGELPLMCFNEDANNDQHKEQRNNKENYDSIFKCNFLNEENYESSLSYSKTSNESIKSCPGTNGQKDTSYTTLVRECYSFQSSSTQATAYINKCLQVNNNYIQKPSDSHVSRTDFDSLTSSLFSNIVKPNRSIRYTDVYFFGKNNKNKCKHTSFQSNCTNERAPCNNTNCKKKQIQPIQSTATQINSKEVKISSKSITLNTEKPETPKSVIKRSENDRPSPCTVIKGDMCATISHVKIGPRLPCPTYGMGTCKGPTCVLATKQELAPIKVTNFNNPRKGVFELVVRRLAGAPLAKNELLLEWTPPVCPAQGPCLFPNTCKVVACRPSRTKCKKSSKKTCRRPSRPCRSVCGSCNPCSPCSPYSPCSPCSPCSPFGPCVSCPPPTGYVYALPRCKPCPPRPCAIPTCRRCCSIPCSTPCLRPCPVAYPRCRRRSRSLPRMSPRRKRISPCRNRSQTCPAVKCRSASNCCTP